MLRDKVKTIWAKNDDSWGSIPMVFVRFWDEGSNNCATSRYERQAQPHVFHPHLSENIITPPTARDATCLALIRVRDKAVVLALSGLVDFCPCRSLPIMVAKSRVKVRDWDQNDHAGRFDRFQIVG